MKRISLLLLLVLTACASSNVVGETLPPTVEPTLTAEPAPTIAPTPTVRIAMIATDPATFSPTADRPQLVEFFAFW